MSECVYVPEEVERRMRRLEVSLSYAQPKEL